MFTKSFLQCNAFTQSNFSMSGDFLQDVADARANYDKRMKQRAVEEAERKRKAIEETLLRNVEPEKKKRNVLDLHNWRVESMRKKKRLPMFLKSLQSIQVGNQQLKTLVAEK